MKKSVTEKDIKNCKMYDQIKRQCKGLNDLYCEKDGYCNFYKPKNA